MYIMSNTIDLIEWLSYSRLWAGASVSGISSLYGGSGLGHWIVATYTRNAMLRMSRYEVLIEWRFYGSLETGIGNSGMLHLAGSSWLGDAHWNGATRLCIKLAECGIHVNIDLMVVLHTGTTKEAYPIHIMLESVL